MNTRTPLGRARGLGSTKDGVAHWWAQRLTSLALIPLSVWFAGSIVGLAGADYATVLSWIGSPFPAIMLILFVATALHHGQQGLSVIIEDYVHLEALKITALVLVKLGAAAVSVATAFSVLRIALAGAGAHG